MVEIIRFLFKFKFVRFMLKLALFLVSLVVFMTSKLIMDELEFRESWEKVTGTITKSELVKSPTANIYYIDLGFNYTFNGKEYNATDNINRSTVKSRIENAVSDYPAGANIDVFVNPDDNSETYVVIGEDIGYKSIENVRIFFYAAVLFFNFSIILLFKGIFVWLFSFIGFGSIFKSLKKALSNIIISKEPKKLGDPRDSGTIQRSRNI